jgi:hypothetical protein
LNEKDAMIAQCEGGLVPVTKLVDDTEHCGSGLARDSDLTVNINVDR